MPRFGSPNRRIDLGLLQKQVAEQVGVCALTITNWERNATSPEVQYVPEILRFLGYDPFASPTAKLPERLAVARRAHGMTQKQLAGFLGVDPATIRDWERGQHTPSRRKRQLIDSFLRWERPKGLLFTDGRRSASLRLRFGGGFWCRSTRDREGESRKPCGRGTKRDYPAAIRQWLI